MFEKKRVNKLFFKCWVLTLGSWMLGAQNFLLFWGGKDTKGGWACSRSF